MAKIKIELNRQGVRALMKSDEMAAMLNGHGARVLARLGSGYGMDAYNGLNRRNVSVFAESADAIAENLRYNTILKAVGGGG